MTLKKVYDFSFYILIAVLIFFMMYLAGVQEYFVPRKYKYTVGTTTRVYIDSDLKTKTVWYDYYVNNEKIEGSITLPKVNVKAPGARYFVKFSANNRYLAELLKDKPVPDNLNEVPGGGWNELPK